MEARSQVCKHTTVQLAEKGERRSLLRTGCFYKADEGKETCSNAWISVLDEFNNFQHRCNRNAVGSNSLAGLHQVCSSPKWHRIDTNYCDLLGHLLISIARLSVEFVHFSGVQFKPPDVPQRANPISLSYHRICTPVLYLERWKLTCAHNVNLFWYSNMTL